MQSLPMDKVVEYIVRYLDALERVVMVDVFISVAAFLMAGYLTYQHLKSIREKKNGSV